MIVEMAKNKGQKFADLLYLNDPKNSDELIAIFHEHFLNSRVHLKSWNLYFINCSIKRLKELKVSPSDIKIVEDVLSLELTLQSKHYIKIQDIIINERNSNNLLFNNINFFNSFKYILDYKNYFMSKHLYSIFKNINLIIDSPKENFNFKDCFSCINSKSLTGVIFHSIDDKEFKFKIPFNVSTNFMFWNKGNLIGIDTSFNQQFDSDILLKHFVTLHLLYKSTPKEIQNNLKKIQNRNFKSILNKISSNKVVDYQFIKKIISPNITYILDIDFNYEYDGLSQPEILSSYILNLDKEFIEDYQIPEQLNLIIFNEVISTIKTDYNIDKKFREELITRLLSSTYDYNTMIYNFNLLPDNNNFIKSFYLKKCNRIFNKLKAKDLSEMKFKNYLLSLGINDKENREKIYRSFINKSITNFKEFSHIFNKDQSVVFECINYLNSDKIKCIIIEQINSGIKDINIINSVLKIEPNMNTKLIQKKIDIVRENNEINKIKKMNLNVKK